MTTVDNQALMLQNQSVRSLTPVSPPASNTQTKGERGQDASVAGSNEDYTASDTEPFNEDDGSWDGRVLTEEELEKFLEMENTSSVVQVGKDFFDTEGNFLYRI